MFDATGAALAGTDIDGGDRFPEVATRAARRTGSSRGSRATRAGGEAHVATPFKTDGRRGVLVLRRSLEGLGGVEDVVRRSLVAAAFVALAVALVAGIALATRLVRRLTALRSTALRHGRARARRRPAGRRRSPRRGRRPRAGVRDDAAAPGGAGAVAADVRQHRVARAAHAADLAGPHAARRRARSSTHAQPDLPEARDQLRRALGQTERLGKLADELLDLSRLDAGVELRVRARRAGRARALGARGVRGRRLARRARRRTAPTLGARRTRARSRASRASCSTTPTATAARTAASCCASTPAGPRSRSRDSGPGVPPGDEERIFERFQRGPEAGEDGGFGLGLAIGRELAAPDGRRADARRRPRAARPSAPPSRPPRTTLQPDG